MKRPLKMSPYTCEQCGRSDSSLRLAVFPYVISIVILTFRRAWSGVFCAECRRKKMTKAKLISLLLGWWGIPWGPIYTLGVLFESSEGKIPAEPNAEYLRELGLYFLRKGDLTEARQAWEASLELKDDPQLREALQRILSPPVEAAPGLPKAKPTPRPRRIPWLRIGIVSVGVILVIAVALAVRLAVTPPPSTPIEPIPTGWTKYSNDSLGFSAYIPNDWEPEIHPQQSDNPARAASFAPALEAMGPDATVITVVAVPSPDVRGSKSISIAELKGSAERWLKDRKVRTIKPVAGTEIGYHPAVWMVHEADAVDGSYTVRGYAAFVSTPKWLYYLEVAGIAEYDDLLQSTYEIFVGSFRSPPE